MNALFPLVAPPWVGRWAPAWLAGTSIGGVAVWQLVGLVALVAVAALVGLTVGRAMTAFGARLGRHTLTRWDDAVFVALAAPARIAATAAVGFAFLGALELPRDLHQVWVRLFQLATIAAGGLAATRLVYLGGEVLERRAEEASAGQPDAEARMRGLRTQILLLRRILAIGIGIVAVALMLVQFDVVRTVGVSLLASAGMAGIVIGLAAQRSIATLLAGLQLSITQPIRIGDTVVVEGESGTVEEITLTYVVVKAWDERRLIVPITRFLEQPFLNLTRRSSALLGTVLLRVDHRLPVAAARAELARILDGHPAWDGRVQAIDVTAADDRSIELRALLSAADAGKLWALRCDVRERLVVWLRDLDGGRYLPFVRVEDDVPEAGASG